MIEAALMIVRIAGLPAAGIEAFASRSCLQEVLESSRLQEELQLARQEMVDRLHSAIHGSPAELRHFLLQVKRDCFNGRSIARQREHSLWPELRRIAGALADRILQLEELLLANETGFASLFYRERDRERRELLTRLENPEILRGVALASPELIAQTAHLRQALDEWPVRKRRKLEASLLRYVSRAALKLSPFSTLTPVALGVARSQPEPGDLRLVGHRWRSCSLVRLKRQLLLQYSQMLLRYTPFRLRLPVTLNETVRTASPNAYSFVRPGFWGTDEAGERMRLQQDALVRANLSGPLISWLRENLALRNVPYGELIAGLAGEFATGPDRIKKILDDLLEIGFLLLLLPWPSDEPLLEHRILRELGSLPGTPELDRFLSLFEQIVRLVDGYSESQDPVRSIDEINRLLPEAWLAAAALGDFPPEVRNEAFARVNINEDVLLMPRSENGGPEILRISNQAVREVAESLKPLAKLLDVYSHRHDFLRSLGAFLEDRWPQRREFDMLEIFSEVQPLWREYWEFAGRNKPDSWGCFNPFSVPAIEELRQLREQLGVRVNDYIEHSGDESRLTSAGLRDLLDPVPDSPSFVGPCLFVQPASPACDLWVLNRMLEGTGRYSSRYTPLMPPEVCRRYTAHFNKASCFEPFGEPAELVDILYARGEGLNVHAAQTPRVLVLPGERSDLPPHRRLGLGDLTIRVDERRQPWLADVGGRRILPVHLGPVNLRLMPPLLKFLTAFGPGEVKTILPVRGSRKVQDMQVINRLILDNVVLMRKRWMGSATELLGEISALADDRAFVVINQWRLARGIPDRIFQIEKTPERFFSEDVYKPQYIDFTSPLFVSIFRTALQANAKRLILEEMLPGPEAFPLDENGQRWAAELQIESLALGPEVRIWKTVAHEQTSSALRTPDTDSYQREPIAAQ